jgi:hypothetical protein
LKDELKKQAFSLQQKKGIINNKLSIERMNFMDVTNQKDQLTYIKEKFSAVMETIESLEAEELNLEELDQLLSVLDDIENKCKEIQ